MCTNTKCKIICPLDDIERLDGNVQYAVSVVSVITNVINNAISNYSNNSKEKRNIKNLQVNNIDK